MILQGAVLWLATVTVTGLVTAAIIISAYMINRYLGLAVETIMTFYIMAAGSLYDESMKVYKSIVSAKTEEARYNLSMIVGRDTEELDERAVIRAAVETVAENTSDGVAAPLIYTALAGPVGGFVYKAVNTMDSMIGYKNERYEYFGRFAARTDDLFNLVPSRISALLMILSAFIFGIRNKEYDGKRALSIWIRDRYAHKSPNSAQTESVCAGALGIRLGGDSKYNGVIVHKPYIGEDIRTAEAADIKRANRLMFATEALLTVIVLLMMMLIGRKCFA